MHISKYHEFLVVRRSLDNTKKFDSLTVMGDKLHTVFVEGVEVVLMEHVNNYEIYTCNPKTGENGWAIEFVKSTDTLIKSFPNFDCVITKNDCKDEKTWLDFQKHINQ